MATLEGLIREDPTAHMCDVVVFNLCTMYELSCDNDATALKKRVLQQVHTVVIFCGRGRSGCSLIFFTLQVAYRFHLHDIAELSFRISP